MTSEQINNLEYALNPEVPSFVSVFAGRIADTGVDPLPIMIAAIDRLKRNKKAELIWEAIVSIGSLSLAKLDSLDADYSSSAQRSLCVSFWSG
jgi:transaldolase